MSKKYYAVYPGRIKIDNEVFFGIDYKITDFINELMEQCKKQKEVIDNIQKCFDDGHFEDGCDCLIIEKYIDSYLKEVSE